MENTRKSVLIIEDEKSLRNALVEKFNRSGFEVFDASDGKVGLQTALDEKPDIILLDVVMPVMDGIKTLEKLREDDWGENAKVIMLTNLNDSETILKAMKHNVPDFFVKVDWALDDIVAEVRRKLNIKN